MRGPPGRASAPKSAAQARISNLGAALSATHPQPNRFVAVINRLDTRASPRVCAAAIVQAIGIASRKHCNNKRWLYLRSGSAASPVRATGYSLNGNTRWQANGATSFDLNIDYDRNRTTSTPLNGLPPYSPTSAKYEYRNTLFVAKSGDQTQLASLPAGVILVAGGPQYRAETLRTDAKIFFNRNGRTRVALQLAPHLFVCPGELRQAESTEFDFDKSVWAIAPEKMKMRGPHPPRGPQRRNSEPRGRNCRPGGCTCALNLPRSLPARRDFSTGRPRTSPASLCWHCGRWCGRRLAPRRRSDPA